MVVDYSTRSVAMEDIKAAIHRLVFEDNKTVTRAELNLTFPQLSSVAARRILYSFVADQGDRVSAKYVAWGSTCEDNRRFAVVVSDSPQEAQASLLVVAGVAVYSVCAAGSGETAAMISSRHAQSIKDAVTASKDTLWRPSYASALVNKCERRSTRIAQPTKPSVPSAVKPAVTPAVAAKPAPNPVAVVKAAPTKAAVVKSSVISLASDSSKTSKLPVEEDDELAFNRKVKRAKVANKIDEDEVMKPVESVSSENSTVGLNQADYEPPEMITKDEIVEYKQRKKDTVTEISLSEGGYMEVEDREVIKEEIIREHVIRQVPKNPSTFKPQPKQAVKPAPTGQRTLADMFRQK